jgi:hypothetical protein
MRTNSTKHGQQDTHSLEIQCVLNAVRRTEVRVPFLFLDVRCSFSLPYKVSTEEDAASTPAYVTSSVADGPWAHGLRSVARGSSRVTRTARQPSMQILASSIRRPAQAIVNESTSCHSRGRFSRQARVRAVHAVAHRHNPTERNRVLSRWAANGHPVGVDGPFPSRYQKGRARGVLWPAALSLLRRPSRTVSLPSFLR